jgi:pimeloyl-ACP methyl ester carboxylesterase
MAESVIRSAPARFSLVGHSMGGRVALEIANLVGNRLSRLVLLDTDVQPRAPGEEQRRKRMLELAQERGMQELARQWVHPLVAPERRDEEALITRLISMVQRYSLDEYKAQVKALLYRPDASSYLQKISSPTLVICGGNCGPRTVERHQLITACLPRGQLLVVEGCGHMTTVERPVAVTEAIRTFMLAENA